MKEVEKNEIKRLSDRLDLIRHQMAGLSLVDSAEKLSKEAQKLMNMPHRRAITKKEQADMGKLKKSVRGLVVVHPMTELGREMGLKEMTGFCKTAF